MDNRASYRDWPKIPDNVYLTADENESEENWESEDIFLPEDVRNVHNMPEPVDVLVQCPNCKTIETVELIGDKLTPCRKFYQKDKGIYHDCGSDQPCHLSR